MSSTQLRQFPINSDRHPEDRERLEAYERKVDEPMKYVSRIFCTEGLQNLFAEYFASRADYYFSGAPRVDIGSSLRTVSKWLSTYVSLSYYILHYTQVLLSLLTISGFGENNPRDDLRFIRFRELVSRPCCFLGHSCQLQTPKDSQQLPLCDVCATPCYLLAKTSHCAAKYC